MNGEILSIDESRDLERLEAVVAKGLQTFVEVGEALSEIRDRKLYRIEHTTFADYCKVKWKMSDRRARQLMDAADVAADIAKSGTTVPKSERHARPLTKLPAEKRIEGWNAAAQASTTGNPTVKEVEATVAQIKRDGANAQCNEPGEKKPTIALPPEKRTLLQWATHFYGLLDDEDRQLFKNFQAGLEGAR